VQGGVVEHAGIQRRGVHVVDGEAGAEQSRGLRELLPERGQGVVLHLVDGRVHPPPAHVPVAPLRPDLDVVDLGVAGQPAGEELLRTAVRTGHVDVPDAGGVRGVEDGLSAGPKFRNTALGAEVGSAARVDVGRTGDGREPDAQARGSSTGRHGGGAYARGRSR
jgi:hypothetical protein